MTLSGKSDYPWKVDDDYPCKARTPGGEWLHFEDLLVEGQKVGHGDGEGNVYPPYGIVVRRDDGLWVEDEPERLISVLCMACIGDPEHHKTHYPFGGSWIPTAAELEEP